MIITEIFIGSDSAITSSVFSLINPSIGIPIANCSALLASIAVLIINEYNSELKIRHTNLRDWINVKILLDEKTLKQSMIVKKIDDKEAHELEKNYNHYLE